MVHNAANGLGGPNAGGGGVANIQGGTLTVTRSEFQSNEVLGGTVASYGGAIFNDAGSTVTVDDCSFIANQATGSQSHEGSRGGAIANVGGSQATVLSSFFENNLAQGANGPEGAGGGGGGGGAIVNLSAGLLSADVGSLLTIDRSTFIGNQVVGGRAGAGASPEALTGQAQGGAVNTLAPVGEAVTVVTSSVFIGNQARGGLSNGVLDGGLGNGGAMDVLSATLTVSGCSFIGNQAIGGAGLETGGNGGTGSGGALSMSALRGASLASLTVTDSTFTGNQAVGGSGGTRPSPPARLAMGGAIAADYGTMELSRSILIGNRAIGGEGGAGGNGGWAVGGAVACGSGAPGPVNLVSITSCLLMGNVAQGGAGGEGAGGGWPGEAGSSTQGRTSMSATRFSSQTGRSVELAGQTPPAATPRAADSTTRRPQPSRRPS
jgi:hypothetical protein